MNKEKLVLAYSGGLDTSVLVHWLDQQGYEVIALCLDLGQKVDGRKKKFNKEIFGAPTFIVNNKLFWGQDRLDYALDEYKNAI